MTMEKKITLESPPEVTCYQNLVRASFDLTFHDLSFTAPGKSGNEKVILHQISGAFKSGQLTAILGPSGAGKTTLMNILAGLKTSGVEGRININGEARDFKEFRKQSAYITQKDYLLPHLTVEEYMLSAAHLKLGNQVAFKQKELTIEIILEMLGLTKTKKTRISCLSGGECKRLSIALELIGDPAIMLLDEPTSGLDSSSSLQCVAVLRDIARSGRTVVATIHQPNSRLLDHFDHVFIVAGGSCVYQGPVKSMVPYFKLLNLNCPSYHNPADFALDVACGEYGNVHQSLVDAIDNGRIIYSETTSSTVTPLNVNGNQCDKVIDLLNAQTKTKSHFNMCGEKYVSPFHTQVLVLLVRTWRANTRDRMLSWIRLVIHFFVAILTGLVYWQIGNDADSIYYNTSLLFFSKTFIVFAGLMPTVATFPLERKVLVREHLNHWYSLKAYYLAKTLVDIPFQIICPTVYTPIIYLMTNQPMDMERFFMFWAVLVGMTFIGQGIGLLSGAAFCIRVAVFIGLASALPFFIISGFLISLSSTPTIINWISYTSFIRYAFEAVMVAIYGDNRPPLDCSSSYCMFRHPKDWLKMYDMTEGSYFWSMIGVLAIILLQRVAIYFILRIKLRRVQ